MAWDASGIDDHESNGALALAAPVVPGAGPNEDLVRGAASLGAAADSKSRLDFLAAAE